MYGLYGLKHHIMKISGDVTDAGRTDKLLLCEKQIYGLYSHAMERRGDVTKRDDDEQGKIEQLTTQRMEAGWLSFAIVARTISHLVEIPADRDQPDMKPEQH